MRTVTARHGQRQRRRRGRGRRRKRGKAQRCERHQARQRRHRSHPADVQSAGATFRHNLKHEGEPEEEGFGGTGTAETRRSWFRKEEANENHV